LRLCAIVLRLQLRLQLRLHLRLRLRLLHLRQKRLHLLHLCTHVGDLRQRKRLLLLLLLLLHRISE
jgi:hypothetical protein